MSAVTDGTPFARYRARMDTLKRIDELMAELAWLARAWARNTPLFQDRLTARVVAIKGELRALAGRG